ncbi:MAG: hypothetical protein AAB383_05105 [Patescibacteria group bacterium]
MAPHQDFVTLEYIENVAGDGDLLDFDKPIIEPKPEEVTVFIDDLYAALAEVESGKRQVEFSLEARGDNYFIKPGLKAGHPFTLPRDPDLFASAITTWEKDGVARAFKLGVFDELCPPMPAEEEEA